MIPAREMNNRTSFEEEQGRSGQEHISVVNDGGNSQDDAAIIESRSFGQLSWPAISTNKAGCVGLVGYS